MDKKMIRKQRNNLQFVIGCEQLKVERSAKNNCNSNAPCAHYQTSVVTYPAFSSWNRLLLVGGAVKNKRMIYRHE